MNNPTIPLPALRGNRCTQQLKVFKKVQLPTQFSFPCFFTSYESPELLKIIKKKERRGVAMATKLPALTPNILNTQSCDMNTQRTHTHKCTHTHYGIHFSFYYLLVQNTVCFYLFTSEELCRVKCSGLNTAKLKCITADI